VNSPPLPRGVPTIRLDIILMSYIFLYMRCYRERRAVVPQSVTIEAVQKRIHLIRGLKVMLDAELAALYGVETKALNRAVKRHASTFPDDFLPHLDDKEIANLRCQIGTSSFTMAGAVTALMRSPDRESRCCRRC